MTKLFHSGTTNAIQQQTLPKRQRGASILLILFLLICFAAFIMVGLKVVPMYLDNMTIEKVLSSLDEDPQFPKYTNGQIRSKISTGLTINNIRDVSLDNLKITRKDGKVLVEFNYEKRKNVFKNLDVVASFENSYEGKSSR